METTIRRLDAARSARRVGAQADLLLDSVASGASVNFMAGLGHDAAMAFWRARLPDITAGSTHLFAAEAEGRLLGVVLLFIAQQPNAPHRADIGKMPVHSAARRPVADRGRDGGPRGRAHAAAAGHRMRQCRG